MTQVSIWSMMKQEKVLEYHRVPTTNYVNTSEQSRHEALSRWETQLDVGKMAYEKGFYTAAARNFTKALKVAESLDLPDNELSSTLLGLGSSYCQLKRYREAEGLFNRLIQIDRDKLGPTSSDLASHLCEAAVLYQKMGNLPVAEDFLRQSLQMLHQLGDNDIQLAKVLKSLALVCCKQENIDEAEPLIYKAHFLVSRESMRHTKLYAEVLGVLALLEVKKRHFAEADETMAKAIEVLEIATGGQHPELVDFLVYAADIFSEQGLAQKSSSLLARAKLLRALVKRGDQ